ncbi:hypothetical protein V2J09_003615 [Rumex salicifolius]
MKAFEHEMSPPSPTSDTDIVKCLNSGKFVAKIRHPISKVWVLLGSYTNPEEAAESCATKKLEYESNPQQNTNVTDYEKQPGVRHTISGKWGAKIKHSGDEVWLGTYNAQKEAAEAYRMSKFELQNGFMQTRRANYSVSHVRKGKWKAVSNVRKVRHRHVYKKSSGQWQTEIRNPMTKARVYLGTFDTAQEVEEAYNKKKSEFDLPACDHSKHNLSVEDGKSNSNCGSDEPFVPTDGSSMMNVNVTSMPTFVSGNSGEFDLGVVDSYGRLIGEYILQENTVNGLNSRTLLTNIIRGHTPQEAADIYTRKKLKYEPRSVEEAPSSFHTNVIDIAKNPSIRRMRSRKWTPDNKHNIKSVWPGTYITPNPSKIELDSSKIACLSKEEGSSICRRRLIRDSGSVYQARSGNWQASTEALPRYKDAFRPLGSSDKESNNKGQSSFGDFDTADEAEEAYNKKKSEFDLMVCAHRKRKWSNKRCEGDESFVCTDGLISVVEAVKEEETVKSMINVEVGSLPGNVNETTEPNGTG